jgi:protein-L-isoaspartate(D-aspartate) O-methyltransferase
MTLVSIRLAFLLNICKVQYMDNFAYERDYMVREQIVARGIRDERVINVMLRIERHLFVPSEYREQSYSDHPIPIGYDQTISQPYIVALMTELCELKGSEKVLEIGTGTGYQTAILAELAHEVFSVERIASLSDTAKIRLARHGYSNIHLRASNGYRGWPEESPFDVILITAAPPDIPDVLVNQLREGGRFIAPVGAGVQELVRGIKRDGKLDIERITYVRFVPML